MAAAHGTVAVESLLSKLHSLNTMQYGLNEKIAADTLEQAHKARLVAIQLRLFQEAETVARSLCSQVAGEALLLWVQGEGRRVPKHDVSELRPWKSAASLCWSAADPCRGLCVRAVALPETPIDAEPMESVFEWLLQVRNSMAWWDFGGHDLQCCMAHTR